MLQKKKYAPSCEMEDFVETHLVQAAIVWKQVRAVTY